MKKINRRTFLENTSKIAITSFLSSYLPNLRAQSVNGIGHKKMILIHFEDGAHHLVGLDPLVLEIIENRKIDPVKRDLREFIPTYEDSDLIKTPHFILGPAAASLQSLSQDFSIITGIQGVSISHQENARFNMSGDEDGRDNIIVAEVFNQMRSGMLGVGYQTNQFREEVTKFRSIDLQQISSVKTMTEENQKLSLQYKPRSSVVQQMVGMQNKVRQFVDLRRDLQTRFPMTNQNSRSLMHEMVASMKLDLSNFNFVSMQNGLDTHFDHANHKTSLGELMSEVAVLIEMLKQTEGSKKDVSLFDETLILVTTDFGRTAYNQNSPNNLGTDHNPKNTTFMISGGLVRGGVKVGESTLIPKNKAVGGRTALVGMPINLTHEKPISYQDFLSIGKSHSLSALNSNTSFLFPGHVMATVFAALELEPVGKAKKYQPLSSLLKKG